MGIRFLKRLCVCKTCCKKCSSATEYGNSFWIDEDTNEIFFKKDGQSIKYVEEKNEDSCSINSAIGGIKINEF